MRVKFFHKNPVDVIKTFGGRPVSVEVIEPCGGLGFEYDHRPKKGDKSDAKHVVNPRPAKNGEPVQCLNCDQPIGPNACEPEGGWAEPPPTPTPA